jgi:hypothetical protein
MPTGKVGVAKVRSMRSLRQGGLSCFARKGELRRMGCFILHPLLDLEKSALPCAIV